MTNARKVFDKISRDTVKVCLFCKRIDCKPLGSCEETPKDAELHLSEKLGGDGD